MIDTTTQSKKCNATELTVGNRLSRTSYLEVIETRPYSNELTVKNETGLTWNISKNIIEKECYSAHQFNEVKEVTRTELIEIFSQMGDSIFTCSFHKLPTPEDFLKLTRGENNIIRSFKEMEKDFKKFKGEERILTGYIIKVENGFGRSIVIDLEVSKEEHNLRSIDHRTLQFVINRNIKYVIKK